MPNRSSKKKPRLPDPNQLAFGIVQAVTGEPPAKKKGKQARGTNVGKKKSS